jgi:CHAD domain-containing protein
VHGVLDDSVRRLIAHDPMIRIGEDTEGVHQARVATRKLRSHLHTFAPILADQWGEPLREELSWLGDLLGDARDADVLLDLLRSTARALPAEHRPFTADLFDQLTAQGIRARHDLLEAMGSERYARVLDALVEAARHPQVQADVGVKPARDVVIPLAANQWKRLRKAARRVDAGSADTELHKVRRRAKQARYALEAVGPLTNGASLRLATRAEKLQGVLGDHQDRVVAAHWLFDAGRDEPRNAFVAGELAGLLRSEKRELRSDAHDLLRQVRKTRGRRAGM